MKTIEDIRQKWGDRSCLKYLNDDFYNEINRVVHCDFYYELNINKIDVKIYFVDENIIDIDNIDNIWDDMWYDDYLVIEAPSVDYTIHIDKCFDLPISSILDKLDKIVEGVL